MSKLGIAALVGLIIGVAVAKAPWETLGETTPEVDGTRTASETLRELVSSDQDSEELDQRYIQMLDALAAVVDHEVSERRRLEEKLNSLTQELGTQTPATQVTEPTRVSRVTSANRNQKPLVERLESTGMSASEALEVKSMVDEISLAQLNFEDQARRGNWDRDARRQGRREVEQLRASLKENLGESKYDQYLFAMGQPNRLTVTDVINNSAAETAGLQPGDVVLRYGGERLYSRRDLRSVTSVGQGGETMTVEILRDGRPLQMFLPRGPLGVQLSMTSVNPGGGG
ncbi:MAG: PDZ domain-containing protein [Pseudomonadota bacterium]